MKIIDGSRQLANIELHITDSEAEKLVDLVVDCRHDIAENGMSESHWHLADDRTELTVYVYATSEELESEVASRLAEEA
jgi:hypothetical protein